MTQPPIEQSFGQLLQQARSEKKHLTPRDLARSANVSEAVYRGWEAGQGHPNRLQLAKMLGFNHWLNPYLPKKVTAAVIEDAPPVIEPRSSNIIAPTFGDALQAERKREGVDQDTLGALLEPAVTGQAVSAWETNSNAPVLVNLEQLYELFPNLVLAPKPRSQDIPVPDGGKGSSRGAMTAPSSTRTWVQPTLTEAAPLRPEPPAGALPIYTFHQTPEPMPPTSTSSSAPVLQDSQLIEYIHALCSNLHGGEWSVRFVKKDNVWRASAEAHTGELEYVGRVEDGTLRGALIDLLREARKELDRRRKLLDDIERDLPKGVF